MHYQPPLSSQLPSYDTIQATQVAIVAKGQPIIESEVHLFHYLLLSMFSK